MLIESGFEWLGQDNDGLTTSESLNDNLKTLRKHFESLRKQPFP